MEEFNEIIMKLDHIKDSVDELLECQKMSHMNKFIQDQNDSVKDITEASKKSYEEFELYIMENTKNYIG